MVMPQLLLRDREVTKAGFRYDLQNIETGEILPIQFCSFVLLLNLYKETDNAKTKMLHETDM